jgi:hypothetical protein
MQLGLWKRGVAYAVALWIIAFLVIALVSVLGMSGRSLPAGIVLLLVAVSVTWAFGARLHFVSITQGLGVGVLWASVNLLLDSLVVVLGFNGGNPEFFTLWVIWGRYLLLLVIPLVLASRRHAPSS